jgi:hypothetical protein
MKNRWFIFYCVITVLLSTVGDIIYYTYADVNYSGKVVFNTESEYALFKEAVSNPQVEYQNNNMSILSSDPPIVVNFKVQVPKDFVFNYGERNNREVVITLMVIPLSVVFLMFFIIMVAYFQFSKLWLSKCSSPNNER